ncbi:unnamed protein product [Caenorhabditis sp. 36 PRJEB53466]|nr:unnamed protein product [Caenorhabditis sp. 36 PRJEB53466]
MNPERPQSQPNGLAQATAPETAPGADIFALLNNTNNLWATNPLLMNTLPTTTIPAPVHPPFLTPNWAHYFFTQQLLLHEKQSMIRAKLSQKIQAEHAGSQFLQQLFASPQTLPFGNFPQLGSLPIQPNMGFYPTALGTPNILLGNSLYQSQSSGYNSDVSSSSSTTPSSSYSVPVVPPDRMNAPAFNVTRSTEDLIKEKTTKYNRKLLCEAMDFSELSAGIADNVLAMAHSGQKRCATVIGKFIHNQQILQSALVDMAGLKTADVRNFLNDCKENAEKHVEIGLESLLKIVTWYFACRENPQKYPNYLEKAFPGTAKREYQFKEHLRKKGKRPVFPEWKFVGPHAPKNVLEHSSTPFLDHADYSRMQNLTLAPNGPELLANQLRNMGLTH